MNYDLQFLTSLQDSAEHSFFLLCCGFIGFTGSPLIVRILYSTVFSYLVNSVIPFIVRLFSILIVQFCQKYAPVFHYYEMRGPPVLQ